MCTQLLQPGICAHAPARAEASQPAAPEFQDRKERKESAAQNRTAFCGQTVIWKFEERNRRPFRLRPREVGASQPVPYYSDSSNAHPQPCRGASRKQRSDGTVYHRIRSADRRKKENRKHAENCDQCQRAFDLAKPHGNLHNYTVTSTRFSLWLLVPEGHAPPSLPMVL